jgi:hypothetical protein
VRDGPQAVRAHKRRESITHGGRASLHVWAVEMQLRENAARKLSLAPAPHSPHAHINPKPFRVTTRSAPATEIRNGQGSLQAEVHGYLCHAAGAHGPARFLTSPRPAMALHGFP